MYCHICQTITHLFELNGNLNFRILSIFLAWDLSMQSRTDLWSHLGYLRIGVNNTVLRFWLRRCRDSVSKVILFTNIHSNSPQRSVNLYHWYFSISFFNSSIYLLCKLVTVNTWRPPAHMRPLAWSQSIFMTKRWERMLMTERWRENTSLSLPELGGSDDSVISSQSVSDWKTKQSDKCDFHLDLHILPVGPQSVRASDWWSPWHCGHLRSCDSAPRSRTDTSSWVYAGSWSHVAWLTRGLTLSPGPPLSRASGSRQPVLRQGGRTKPISPFHRDRAFNKSTS